MVRQLFCPHFVGLSANALLAGRDVDSSAFLKVYENNLEEDEVLFPADDGDSQMAEREDEEDDDDDNGEPKNTISARELEAQLRKAAREKVVHEVSIVLAGLTLSQTHDDVKSFDPLNTSYMDGVSDDDEPPLRTREVEKRAPKVTRTRDAVDAMVRSHLHSCYPYELTRPNVQCFQSSTDESQRSQDQAWAKKLGSSTISGPYQGPSGGAVTAAGARARGKSSRMAAKPLNPREVRRKPVKEGSMLAGALRKGKAG